MESRPTPPPRTTQARAPGTGVDQDAAQEDIFKIMLATDNHIGFNERDPIRGQDSINTFKEILQLAVKHDVDFILLGGDLFHENRPSRDCLYEVMALLREYCLGDRPIQIELLSDPDDGKPPGYSFPAINYEDPNLNIAIPVFSIHGNHDDPQGAGPQGALCALDMLSVSGLINYIGKIDLPVDDANASTTGIAIKPILLRKGTSKLALYGCGNVKDQRMHFELRSNRVRMYMPKDKDSWFNILLVHQNRVPHGPQIFVPEGMFDDSIDLVVWGHEHDCRISPEPVAGKRYLITQPGSSVATSLGDGEAIEKHVALLEIHGKEFKMTNIPLQTVRPFVVDEVSLLDAADDCELDISDRMAIEKFLKSKVNDLIKQADELWEERNAKRIESGEPELEKMLPLIRLKVDTTGVSEMSNPLRFGQDFIGRIANPRDLLHFTRSKSRSARAADAKIKADEPEYLSIDDPNLTNSEKLAKVRVNTLVKEYLAAQEMQLLAEAGMSDAIDMFVDKDDIHAIQNHVHAELKNLMAGVRTKGGAFDEDDLDDIVGQVRETHAKEYIEKRDTGRTSNPKGKGKARDEGDASDAGSVDSMMMDVDVGGSDFDEEPVAPPPKKTTTRRAAASTSTKKAAAATKAKATATTKGRGKKKVVDSDDEEEDAYQQADDDDDEIEEVSAPPPKKRTNRAATLTQTAAAKKVPAKKAAGNKQATLSFAPSGRTTGTRQAATRAKKKVAEVIDSD